jgi:hypothetical protein
MKTLLLVTLTFSGFVLSGQDTGKKIQNIRTPDQAHHFIEADSSRAEMIELSETDTSETARKIMAAAPGQILTVKDYTYKVIGVRKSFSQRVSFIYLNGDSLSSKQVDSLRRIIISKYRSGVPFTDLAKDYDMNGNSTGDLGWVAEDMLLREFSTAIKAHQKGEIFTIDIPAKKWYYVTLKTFDEREMKIYSVLKVKTGG